MAPSLATEIEQRIAATEDSYYRLVLLVGPGRSGKTSALQAVSQRLSAPLLNVNLLLSEKIISLPHQQRALRVADVLAELLDNTEQPLVVLDNTEVLFDPELRQDPLRLLQSLSRTRTVVAAWAGELTDAHLVYAEPGHPEYRRYSRPDAILVPTMTAG
jgi:hypothetical protein